MGSPYRINFNLHRAGGLWLWAALLVFAWSSVYMNLWDTVYTWSTRTVFDYKAPWTELADLDVPLNQPKLDWREAESIGAELMARRAGKRFRNRTLGYAQSDSGQRRLCLRHAQQPRCPRPLRSHVGFLRCEYRRAKLLLLLTGQDDGNIVTS